MKKIVFTLILAFSCIFMLAQQKKIPKSIYTFKNNLNQPNLRQNVYNVKKQISTYSFLQIDTKDIASIFFTITPSNLNKKASTLIFDSYTKAYQQKNIESSFFDINTLYLPRRAANF